MNTRFWPEHLEEWSYPQPRWRRMQVNRLSEEDWEFSLGHVTFVV